MHRSVTVAAQLFAVAALLFALPLAAGDKKTKNAPASRRRPNGSP